MTFTPKMKRKTPLFGDFVMVPVYVPNSAAAGDMTVPVPGHQCQLSHAETCVVSEIDATGDMEIDLELNAASGTEMMTITVAASSVVGTIDTATVSTQSACVALSYDDTARDYVNIEVDGSASAAGAVMLYLFFENYRG